MRTVILYDSPQTGPRVKRSAPEDRPCPVARAAAQLVDAWTFIILRGVFPGNRRFEGMRQHTGMSPRSLTLRLLRLVEQGILVKVPGKDAPAFQKYRLTPKGLDRWPVLVTLHPWGDRWAGPWGRSGPPPKLVHRGHAHPLHAVLRCAECSETVDACAAEVVIAPAAVRQACGFH